MSRVWCVEAVCMACDMRMGMRAERRSSVKVDSPCARNREERARRDARRAGIFAFWIPTWMGEIQIALGPPY